MEVLTEMSQVETTTAKHQEPPLQNNSVILFSVFASLIVLGLVGNCLILIGMANNKFNKMSTSVYLAVLAALDTLTLFSGPFVLDILPSDIWLNFNVRNYSLIFCMATDYILYTSANMSSWMIVAITVERFIAIVMPHRWDNFLLFEPFSFYCATLLCIRAAHFNSDSDRALFQQIFGWKCAWSFALCDRPFVWLRRSGLPPNVYSLTAANFLEGSPPCPFLGTFLSVGRDFVPFQVIHNGVVRHNRWWNVDSLLSDETKVSMPCYCLVFSEQRCWWPGRLHGSWSLFWRLSSVCSTVTSSSSMKWQLRGTTQNAESRTPTTYSVTTYCSLGGYNVVLSAAVSVDYPLQRCHCAQIIQKEHEFDVGRQLSRTKVNAQDHSHVAGRLQRLCCVHSTPGTLSHRWVSSRQNVLLSHIDLRIVRVMYQVRKVRCWGGKVSKSWMIKQPTKRPWHLTSSRSIYSSSTLEAV